MDSQRFDRLSKTLATWVSRRGFVKGLVGMAGGAAIGRATTRAQGGTESAPVDAMQSTEPSVPTESAPLDAVQPTEPFVPTEPFFPSEVPPTEPTLPTEVPPTEPTLPTEVPPTEPMLPTEVPPTEPTLPTETPWATDTPTTPTPAPMGTETPTPMATETTPTGGQQAPVTDPRPQIAAICQEAANVLEEDVADPGAFDGHPHPKAAYGFLRDLSGVALWGTNAPSWDDAMLSNFVMAADLCAFAIRIGADAYYEMIKDSLPEGVFPKDPDTCIFAELEKYENAIAQCAPDDAFCRMTAFWNFTALQSCRRCLRAW